VCADARELGRRSATAQHRRLSPWTPIASRTSLRRRADRPRRRSRRPQFPGDGTFAFEFNECGAIGTSENRPRTLCLEWLDPLFSRAIGFLKCGTRAAWIVLGEPGRNPRRVAPRDIVMASPDIRGPSCRRIRPESHRKEARSATGARGGRTCLPRERNRVWLVDGSSYFNRPGPRLVEGLEILAHVSSRVCFRCALARRTRADG